MTIAASVQSYLNRDGVRYEMITHERTRTAITAHTPRTFRVANWRNASCCRTARDTRWPCFLPRTTESVPIDGHYGGARLPQVPPDFARAWQPEQAPTVADLADKVTPFLN